MFWRYACAVGLIVSSAACRRAEQKDLEIHVLPWAYRGVVVVTYGDPNGSETVRDRDGAVVVRVDNTGRCALREELRDVTRMRFFYEGKSKGRRELFGSGVTGIQILDVVSTTQGVRASGESLGKGGGPSNWVSYYVGEKSDSGWRAKLESTRRILREGL